MKALCIAKGSRLTVSTVVSHGSNPIALALSLTYLAVIDTRLEWNIMDGRFHPQRLLGVRQTSVDRRSIYGAQRHPIVCTEAAECFGLLVTEGLRLASVANAVGNGKGRTICNIVFFVPLCASYASRGMSCLVHLQIFSTTSAFRLSGMGQAWRSANS